MCPLRPDSSLYPPESWRVMKTVSLFPLSPCVLLWQMALLGRRMGWVEVGLQWWPSRKDPLLQHICVSGSSSVHGSPSQTVSHPALVFPLSLPSDLVSWRQNWRRCFFALVFLLQLVPPSWTLKGILARRQKMIPNWPFTQTPHGAEGAVEVGRLEGKVEREGQWRGETKSWVRRAESRWGLWRLKPVSAGRLASPRKEEGRARVEGFRESSLPDNSTLKQVSRLFDQKTLNSFRKPQESYLAVRHRK